MRQLEYFFSCSSNSSWRRQVTCVHVFVCACMQQVLLKTHKTRRTGELGLGRALGPGGNRQRAQAVLARGSRPGARVAVGSSAQLHGASVAGSISQRNLKFLKNQGRGC